MKTLSSCVHLSAIPFLFLSASPTTDAFARSLWNASSAIATKLKHRLPFVRPRAKHNNSPFLPPLPTSSALKDRLHIVILPGFMTSADDYTKAGSLAPNLQARGLSKHHVHVLPVQRPDWARIFLGGMTDLEFWKGRAAPNRPAYAWYLERVAQTINEITTQDPSAKIVLLGHSAGGWLARAALGYSSVPQDNQKDLQIQKLESILGLVTLGSPHVQDPLVDMTFGAIRVVNERFPGAYCPDKFYVTLAGHAVSSTPSHTSLFSPSFSYYRKQIQDKAATHLRELGKLAYVSYHTLVGAHGSMNKGKVIIGDGIVPASSAHLEGALHLNLPQVVHCSELALPWYGSDLVVDQWFQTVLSLATV